MRSRRVSVRVTFREALVNDLKRIIDHLGADGPAGARRAVVRIMYAMLVLGRHPSIG